ncbi:glycosyl hydrolase [Anopheles sinensis]|uniref:Glycosyl hydrolase n=1 Tax=Anopheles sinensis TaxID=74873 RepID=A0A084WS79_ANOSI|nr:glycosyl hydrolase [Anopheles sinensis]
MYSHTIFNFQLFQNHTVSSSSEKTRDEIARTTKTTGLATGRAVCAYPGTYACPSGSMPNRTLNRAANRAGRSDRARHPNNCTLASAAERHLAADAASTRERKNPTGPTFPTRRGEGAMCFRCPETTLSAGKCSLGIFDRIIKDRQDRSDSPVFEFRKCISALTGRQVSGEQMAS